MGSEESSKVFILGLTGSIGMGKSTVVRVLKDIGVPVVDADEIVHALYAEGGQAGSLIEEAFPGSTEDGEVKRDLLSKAVIGSEEAMKKLEAIVHPLVANKKKQLLMQILVEGRHPVVVFDIPLLYETSAEGQCDAVVVVSAPAHLQWERVLARPGMTDDKFQYILARQVPDEEKRKRAQYVLDNRGTVEELEKQVVDLIDKLKTGMKG